MAFGGKHEGSKNSRAPRHFKVGTGTTREAPQVSAKGGIGYLIIQAYATFDMPRMCALLIVLFVLAIGANAAIGQLARSGAPGRLGRQPFA
ncbi:MAG: hypothetical protein ABI593_16970 [Betaproteobacteria bacterium]